MGDTDGDCPSLSLEPDLPEAEAVIGSDKLELADLASKVLYLVINELSFK